MKKTNKQKVIDYIGIGFLFLGVYVLFESLKKSIDAE